MKVLCVFFRAGGGLENFSHVFNELQRRGAQIDFLTFDARVPEYFADRGLDISASRTVPFGRAFRLMFGQRNQHMAVRMLLWLYMKNTRKLDGYDVAYGGYDGDVIEYNVGRHMPLVISQFTAGYYSKDMFSVFELDRTRHPIANRILLPLDRLSGGKLLCRYGDMLTNYNPMHVIVDRLMGLDGPGNGVGQGSCNRITVGGEKYIEIYEYIGVPAHKIRVTGIPEHDIALRLKATLTAADNAGFLKELGVPAGKRVFTFFSSLAHDYNQAEVDECRHVIKTLRKKVDNVHIVFKLHPKLAAHPNGDGFIGCFSDLPDMTIIKDHRGADFNTRLICASDFLVQKHSTVGFLASVLRTRIISYKLYERDEMDNMYRDYNNSIHVESAAELENLFGRVAAGDPLDEILEKQAVFCRQYCLDDGKTIERVADCIIDAARKKNKINSAPQGAANP